MNLSLSADDLAFRDEVRAFIARYLPKDAVRMERLSPTAIPEEPVFRDWHKALHARGWVAPYWPQEFGGTGWSPAQRYIFETECGMAGAPTLLPFGIHMVGPVIIRFGTPEQQAHYLPRILSGEDYWCQGYSEPGSGSDLASLKTRAVRDGDHYIVNGTKIWTTHAHFASRIFALVRTADTPKKQDGISFLLIDMKSPGISVRPIVTIGGDHEVNQVFFDDVRVPVGNRVGEENKGWSYAKYLLEFERGASFRASHLRRLADDLTELGTSDGAGRAVEADPALELQLARIHIDIDALEMMEIRLLGDIQSGRNPGAVSSILKLRGSEISQSLSRLGVELLGERSIVWERRRPLYGLNEPSLLPESEVAIVPAHLDGRARTIFGGSSEIQREIIAKHIVGVA